MKKIRWGILGVAKIATAKVIPAMQHCSNAEIAAIASRDLTKARTAADQLGIPQAYGSYEELLGDPSIDAIYNPLPNHLHVPWSIRAAEAGKHVLCEKPIALSVAETRDLIAARDKAHVKIGEAFMARTHPQWLRAAEIVHSGKIGDLRVVSGYFSYFNRDPKNVRNIAAIGGGGIFDIGCYPITLSRMIFRAEPLRVQAFLDRDPDFKTDRLASVILEYPQGHASFTCSTQLVPYQRMHIFGTTGHIEIEIPFNAPPDKPTRIFLNGETIEFPICDQYTIQGELFSRAILEDTEVPVPLEDALNNMKVIEAILADSR
jgi:predicted dehydrogenase